MSYDDYSKGFPGARHITFGGCPVIRHIAYGECPGNMPAIPEGKKMFWRICLISLAMALVLVPSGLAQDTEEAAAPQETEASTDTEATEATGEAANADPNWFDKLLARTIEPLPATAVAEEGGYFSASIPATLVKPVEFLDEFYLLTLDFGPGAESMAECYVYVDDLDLAGSLLAYSDVIFGLIEQTYGKIEAKAIYGIDAGGIGAVPYMGIDWIYRCQNEETGPLAGQAKHLIASKEGRALYCQTTAIGYDDAFFNLFQSLVASIEYGGEKSAEPYFEELLLLSIGGQTLGVGHGAHRLDQDGDIEQKVITSLLIPVDQQNVQSSDSVAIEFATVDGEIINQIEVEAEGSELVTQLNLSLDDEGEWQVDGTFQGKELTAKLGAAELTSDLDQRLAIRELAKKAAENGDEAPKITFPEWNPDLDPSQFMDHEITYLGSHEKGMSLSMKSGPATFAAVTDMDANVISVTIPLGASEMKIDRAYSRGDALYPLELRQKQASEAAAEPEAEAAPEAEAEGASDAEPSGKTR